MVRQLNESGTDFARRLSQSLRTLVATGGKDDLREVVHDALALAGGPLTDGYESKRTFE